MSKITDLRNLDDLLDLGISDGTNGQVLTTNGSGTFTFADASGGISDIVGDTTPQLGGDLDLNSSDITGTGNINITGSGTFSGNVTAYSDKRLKEEIKVIENAVSKVKELRGVTYKDIKTKEVRTGVIAQEVEKVLPEAVVSNENTGMLSVAYGNMVGLLIESVKELTERVEDLEKKLGE